MSERIPRLSEYQEREPGWWYKHNDTVVVHPSGHYIQSAREIRIDLMCNALEWCGCGNSEQALTYLRDVMRVIPQSVDGYDQTAHNARHAARKTLLANNPAEYFTYYWLDNMSLTEHGGSVPGWLTEAGEALLADLEEALAP